MRSRQIRSSRRLAHRRRTRPAPPIALPRRTHDPRRSQRHRIGPDRGEPVPSRTCRARGRCRRRCLSVPRKADRHRNHRITTRRSNCRMHLEKQAGTLALRVCSSCRGTSVLACAFLRCPVDSPPKEGPLETLNFAGARPALPSVCSAPLLSTEKKDNSSIFFSHSQSLFLLQHSHVGHSCDDVQPRGLSGPAQRNVPVPARIGK